MSDILTGRSQFAADICDVFGIKDARTIEIRLTVDDVVRVRFEQMIREDAGVRIIEVIRRYEMREKPTDVTAIGDESRCFTQAPEIAG